MKTDRISRAVAAVLLAASIGPAALHAQGARGQSESVADAARRAREQSKSRQPGKVFTNEDISQLKGAVSVVGAPPEPSPAPGTEAAPAAGAATAGAADKTAAAPKAEAKDEAYWRSKFADARRKLADDQKELDVLQREYNLKQQQFYMDPNVALREQYGRADLNKTLDQINAKKADVEKDQQAISALEDQLRQAGGDPGWARDPNPPPN